MRKVSEYEQQAEKCRQQARATRNPEHRRQLEQMAETWAMLAKERTRQLAAQLERTRQPAPLNESES
jgi:hypothetical protein